MDVKQLFTNKIDRRRMLGNLGMMGAGAVLTACGTTLAKPDEEKSYDAAILTFALNLEYLEAAFYLAAVGRISEIQAIGGNAEIVLPAGFDGKTSIAFDTPAIEQYAQEIANDELNHVVFLRSAIGEVLGAPVADRPAIDLSGSFSAAANAAFGTTLEPAFNPFLNELFFLHGAFIFEDVGVTAYNGAAPFVTDKKTVLQKAAGILAVEAYHAGEIRTLLYAQKDVTTPYGVTVETIVQKISDLRAAAGGGSDQGLVVEGKANIIPTDKNSIAFARTPRQVANIVFLDVTGTAAKGGFFPNGLTVPTELTADFGFLLSL